MFELWSKGNCPMCDQTKHLLKSNNIEFIEKRIGTECTKEQLLEIVPTAKSVPQILLDGNLIGGLSELKQFLTEQKHKNV